MNQFFIPIKAAFAEPTINVLNIDSGLEFLAENIFCIVTKHSVYDSGYKSLMEV